MPIRIYVNEPMVMEAAAFLTAYFTLDPRLKAVYRCFCLWANNRRVSSYATPGGLSFEALFVMVMYALFRRNFSALGKRCSIYPNLLKHKEHNPRTPRIVQGVDCSFNDVTQQGIAHFASDPTHPLDLLLHVFQFYATSFQTDSMTVVLEKNQHFKALGAGCLSVLHMFAPRNIGLTSSGLSEAFTTECERASALLVEGQSLAEVFKAKQTVS